jgi:hypothetical protein
MRRSESISDGGSASGHNELGGRERQPHVDEECDARADVGPAVLRGRGQIAIADGCADEWAGGGKDHGRKAGGVRNRYNFGVLGPEV